MIQCCDKTFWFLVYFMQAKDKGYPSMSSNTTVEVLVMDTNDNAPIFTKRLYTASVPENAFGGYQVTYLTIKKNLPIISKPCKIDSLLL